MRQSIFRAFTGLILALWFCGCAAHPTQRVYLSGKGIDDAVPWDFYCSKGDKSGQWTTIPVPSCWDVLGFGKLTYGNVARGAQQLSDEQGKYRRSFSVPADWNGQTINLVFDGSMTDTQVWVNGKSAGPMHQGAFYRFQYDVTKLVNIGKENLLEVTVDKESENDSVNKAERRADYWNYGGIFRPVYLNAVPKHHIDRVAIDAKADGSFSADIFTAGGTSVRAQVMDLQGNPIGVPITQSFTRNHAKLKAQLDSPKLWSAETPNLYQVEVTLCDGPFATHRMRQRFGFRTIEVREGDGVYVNGQRILLKGVDRHCFWPDSGRATSERISRMDVALMKEMNMNAVRTSHYPPDEHFLDTCDEMGLYVLDELGGWHGFYNEPTGRRLIEEMLTRDVNHPSILFWDNGNEGGSNPAVDDDFAAWDPQQREVLHPWAKFRKTNTKHYPNYAMMQTLSQGPEVFFPTEFQHALFDGGGGAGLADSWDVLRQGKTSAGGIIWAYVDEAVKRPNGTMDSSGNQAPDGVVGPYREKEGSFYAIKQIWSPVVVTRDTSGQLLIENRYDFINTSQCKFKWQLRKFSAPTERADGFSIVDEGELPAPSIVPHHSGSITLDPPARNADALALRVDDPNGKELWTWVWPLKKPETPSIVSTTHPITAKEDAAMIAVSAGDLALSFSTDTGFLVNAARGDKSFSLVNGPRVAVGDQELDEIEHGYDGDDYVVYATYFGDLDWVEWRIKPDGWVQVDYAYKRQGLCDYLGVSFDLPERDVKGMKWLGNGPYRVWKNRLAGGTLNVWQKDYNNTMTGFGGLAYPEFKGYYSDVRWMQFKTSAGPILVALDDPSLFVQVLRPDFPGNPKPRSPTTATTRLSATNSTLSGNAWTGFPNAGFSVLNGIPAIGNKFTPPSALGPQGQQNVASGNYRGRIRLFLGEMGDQSH